MLPNREDKKTRAKRALEYHLWREDMFLPRPDGEVDTRYDMVVDHIAEGIVRLAALFSESAAWMRWSSEARPPSWALPFLTREEIEGKGPPPVEPQPEPEEPPAPVPAKKKGRSGTGRGKGKKWMTDAMRDPNSEEFIGLRKEHIDYLMEYYHELPAIDPETGKPPGWICDL